MPFSGKDLSDAYFQPVKAVCFYLTELKIIVRAFVFVKESVADMLLIWYMPGYPSMANFRIDADATKEGKCIQKQMK
jgi:hypothetical protein